MAYAGENRSGGPRSADTLAPNNEEANHEVSSNVRLGVAQGNANPASSTGNTTSGCVAGHQPQGRQIYNVEYQSYPPGEIQFHRKFEARRISWLVEYTPDPEVGEILFCDHDPVYGGPFAFLSSDWPCSFTVPGKYSGEKFVSVGAFFFYFAALCMNFNLPAGFLPAETALHGQLYEREATYPDGSYVSSLNLSRIVQETQDQQSVQRLRELVEAFFEYGKDNEHYDWVETWDTRMNELLPDAHEDALRSQYYQNPELKRLLMMTGNYNLIHATTEGGGIGVDAHEALGKRHMWEKPENANVLGRLLMNLRAEFRAQEPEWPTVYAFDYFREIEMANPHKREDRNKVKQESGEALAMQTWMELGGAEAAARHRKNQEKADKVIALQRAYNDQIRFIERLGLDE